ncbi:hypothetical protein VNO77_20473 [Canavalia gladiata]|uniref:Uncharacterized protein n=1 Tax=Canavalia gladiata TaxID=3824 RepID=A0AAN9LSU6_CANGL
MGSAQIVGLLCRLVWKRTKRTKEQSYSRTTSFYPDGGDLVHDDPAKEPWIHIRIQFGGVEYQHLMTVHIKQMCGKYLLLNFFHTNYIEYGTLIAQLLKGGEPAYIRGREREFRGDFPEIFGKNFLLCGEDLKDCGFLSLPKELLIFYKEDPEALAANSAWKKRRTLLRTSPGWCCSSTFCRL